MTSAVDLLSSAGVAAIVSAALTVMLKPLLESKLQRKVTAELEGLRAAYVSEHEFLKELVKRNSELYPTLVESVYRCRNIARELLSPLLQDGTVLHAELRTHALALSDSLYRSRAFLPPAVFDPVHRFKRVLEKFVFDYELLTGSNPSEGVRLALNDSLERLDSLYELAVTRSQDELHVRPTPVSSIGSRDA